MTFCVTKRLPRRRGHGETSQFHGYLIKPHQAADARQPFSKLSGIYGPGSEEREKRCPWRLIDV
jgi:hypothetical protein